MPDDNSPGGSNSDNRGDATTVPGFGNAFNGGKDRAGDAEKSTEDIREDTPGAGSGDWDEDEESVSGDVSAYVHKLESGRDAWHPRQTAHGALDVMQGFLGSHFKNFQTAADNQRKASENPGTTSDMAASTMKSATADDSYKQASHIKDEDQPGISEEVRRKLKGTHDRTGGAVLVATGMSGHAVDVAVDPAHDKAYVVMDSGTLYGVDLSTHTKRQFMTSGGPDGKLGTPGGVALDGDGKAYITDSAGGRLLRVDLSNGHTEKVAAITQACGVRLDETGTKAYVTTLNGKLYQVDLRTTKTEPKKLADDLGTSTTAVALDGTGKAYTGNRDQTGSMREVDLQADPPDNTRRVAPSSGFRSGGIAVDGTGTIYAGDHWVDTLYTIDLTTGRERVAVKTVSGAFSPLGITLDSADAALYVSTWEGQLWRFSLQVLRSPELLEITTRA
ncbi:YncE family protein [Streptomyces sp. CC224B]|uniref:YncE family protein n=1 Tax=Streptomyces sp. CC224B TaxID=3044571 RepID=UPI0024A9BD70|nr:YncE family protein [Streptomyces sp. CC224B]